MMKKLWLFLLPVLALCLFVGCASKERVESMAETLQPLVDGYEAREERVEDIISSVEDQMTTPTENLLDAQETWAGLDTDPITKEQAEEIALTYAGLTREQVTALRTEYEIDDGVPRYDVEFYADGWEYEFEIHEKTGVILSYDKDREQK